MRKPLLALAPLIFFAQGAVASPGMTMVAQPTTCISSQFSASGDQYWKSMILKLTNNCGQAVDFQNASVTFKNKTNINTAFWGDFSPLSYPDNALNITSQAKEDGNYQATLTLHFPTFEGSKSTLPAGNSIQLKYEIKSDEHIDGSVNVYLTSGAQTGSLVLNNLTAKPANISQNYAVVRLSMNGQVVKNIQLPWAGTETIPSLAAGSYTLAADSVSDTGGNNYQGSATPNSFTLAPNGAVKASVSYTQVQQAGKVTIRLDNLPNQLSGYTGKPSVVLTQEQTGTSVSQVLDWNSSATVSMLKEGSVYRLSTGTVNYNGYNCTPGFLPATLTAHATNAPVSVLSYKCIAVAQDTVTLNVTGAPPTLASLKITLTPNDNTAVISQTINLTNGTGSDTVLLTDGVIYSLSTPAVAGYSINYAPQPLTASANGTATLTFTKSDGTPVGLNGQLTVCGTQLCNEQGTAIQLKGMSTHGLQWYGQETCIKPASLDVLSKNFKANVIRLAMYVQEDGYETNPAKYTKEVSDLIIQAYDRGMYVIVDWHMLDPGDPNYNLTRAKKFFTDIATTHKNKNNIIYEIANEPNGVSWAAIKTYANQLIPVIRAIDNKAPILIGTRGWSSLGVSTDDGNYQEIVNNPVQFPNIMYTFHFYAASHGNEYLNALDNASRVLPIFVTEFGTQTSSGDGVNNFPMTDRYMQLMASRKIGWTNWNYSDDFRSGAIWKANTCTQGAWTDSNLKPAGVYIKNKILTP